MPKNVLVKPILKQLTVLLLMFSNPLPGLAWKVVDTKTAAALMGREDVIYCDTAGLTGGLVECPGAENNKAVLAQKQWKTRWIFSRNSSYKANKSYELFARLKIENAYDYPPGEAVDGTVWFGAKSRQGVVNRTIRIKDIPDADWHIWRVGQFEATPRGQEYFFINKGRHAKNVWIDKLFLIPVKQCAEERQLVQEMDGRQPAWRQAAFHGESLSELALNAGAPVKLEVFSSVGDNVSAEINVLLENRDGRQEKQKIQLSSGSRTVIIGNQGEKIRKIISRLEAKSEAATLYAKITSPAPEILQISELKQQGDDYYANDSMHEAVDLGNFIEERKKLGRSPCTFRIAPASLKLQRQHILPEWETSGEPEKIRLELARNEYESFQLAVIPVNLSSDHEYDLNVVSDNPSLDISCATVEYVKCTAGAYPKPWHGYFPDPLIPLGKDAKVTVAPFHTRLLLFTVHAPEHIAPGEYSAKIIFSDSSGGKSINVTAKVRNFSLPVRSSLKSAFWFWGNQKGTYGSLADWYNHDQTSWKTLSRWYSFFSRYRMTPNEFNQDFSRWFVKVIKEKDGRFSFDLKEFEHYADFLINKCNGTAINIGNCNESWKMFTKFSYIDRTTGQINYATYKFMSDEYINIFTAYLKAISHMLKEKGLWEYAYLQLTDEFKGLPKTVHDRLASILRKEIADLKILAFGWGDYGISVPVSIDFDKAKAEKLREQNQEVWWYVCVSPKPIAKGGKVTNYFIDEMGINHRFHFWQAWEKGIDGFLYWGVNMWQYAHYGNIPAGNQPKWPDREWVSNVFPSANGDGYLLYPGPEEQPRESLRLIIMRDGLEDFEYLKLLADHLDRMEQEKSSGNNDWILNTKKLLAEIRKFITEDYDRRDEKMIHEYRRRVAALLEKLP